MMKNLPAVPVAVYNECVKIFRSNFCSAVLLNLRTKNSIMFEDVAVTFTKVRLVF